MTPVTMLGDSITAQAFNTYYKAWPQFALSRIGAPNADTVLYVNAGVAGEIVSQLAARVAAVLATNPKIVVVFGGANDAGQGDTVTLVQTTDAFTDIFDDLQAADVPFIVCTVAPRALSGMQTTEQVKVRVGEMNDWLRANIATWPNATLCDWAIALSVGGDGVTHTPAYLEDVVHWTELGARAAAPDFATALTSVLRTL